MRQVFIQHSALVSALGADLPEALARLQQGGVEPVVQAAARNDGAPAWPCFRIADADTDWYARARRLITRALADLGPADRDAPLFLASCSLDIGAREHLATGIRQDQQFLDFADQITHWLDWRGPIYWVSSACTSASNALLAAHDLIAQQHADEAVVLALELANAYSVAGFGAMQLLDTRRPRPLAADRAGLVLGEAVAAIRLGTAPARWRLAGGANLVAGADPAGASASTVAAMCRRALARAGLTPADIGLIKLQAAGSPANDATEIEGLREVFGTLPALCTLKAELGHTLGASGAAELALLCACLACGVWPAPRTPAEPALNAELARTPPPARYLLANILGFGGGHAALLLEDCA